MIAFLEYLKESRIICRTLAAIEARVKKNHVWLTFLNCVFVTVLFGFAVFSYVDRKRDTSEIKRSQEHVLINQDTMKETKFIIDTTIDNIIEKLKNKSGGERKNRSSKGGRRGN